MLNASQRAALGRILDACDAGSGKCAKWVLANAPWYAEKGTLHYDQPHLEALFEYAQAHGTAADWKVLEGASDEGIAHHLRGTKGAKRKRNQPQTRLDFGRKIDQALDALDELSDVPNSDVQHDFGRVVFHADPDDPRMLEIYSHLRRRGITWLGAGRESNQGSGSGSLCERLKNAY